MLPETNQGLFNPLHAILPYENFIGSVLGRSFRISRFIRSETHGNVYAVEGLSPAAFAYQARAYTLRGMPPKIREYRVRNLKKFASKPSFVCSFDQHGKKFVINLVGETKEQFFTTAQSKGTKACEFGTAQQKHTPDYDEAFPKLQVTCRWNSLLQHILYRHAPKPYTVREFTNCSQPKPLELNCLFTLRLKTLWSQISHICRNNKEPIERQ